MGSRSRTRRPPPRGEEGARRARLSARALVRRTRARGRRGGGLRRGRGPGGGSGFADRRRRWRGRGRDNRRGRGSNAGGRRRGRLLAPGRSCRGLGGGRGRKSFPRTCGRRGFVSRWLRRLCFFPLRISRRPDRGGHACRLGRRGRKGVRPTGRARRASPGGTKLRGLAAGAGDDKALTHFGFDGIFALLPRPARQPSKCSAPARLPPSAPALRLRAAPSRGSPPRRRPRSRA